VYLVAAAALWRRAASFSTSPPGASIGFGRRIIQIGRERWPRVIFATVFFEGLSVFGALAFIPWHLHTHFGVSLTLAGLAPGAFGLGGLGYALFARRLLARLGEGGLARTGGMCLMLGLIGLALGGDWILAIPESALLGLGYYMLHNTLQTNATQMAPANRGTAVSLFAACFFLGQSLGVSIASETIATAGTAVTFAGAALILLMTAVAFAAALRRRVAAAP
jgi:predicted MFS family arabinose efflux permease